MTIDIETARRFILGKQGLWPGRRWRGLKGTEQDGCKGDSRTAAAPTRERLYPLALARVRSVIVLFRPGLNSLAGKTLDTGTGRWHWRRDST
jgi:hypothetical protein